MTVWYFAFGSNMCREVFLGRRVMKSVGEPAVLEGHRLAFTEPGFRPLGEPSFASIELAPGERMHGVLWPLSIAEFERLLGTESPNYEVVEVSVLGASSGRVTARTLRSRRRKNDAHPSRRYLRLLVRGAREHGLPAEYVEALERHPTTYLPILSNLVEHVLLPVLTRWLVHARPTVRRWLKAPKR